MNVGELIEALKQFDSGLEVETEGCDCIGDAGHLVQEGDVVMIMRGHPETEKERMARETLEVEYALRYKERYDEKFGPVVHLLP